MDVTIAHNLTIIQNARRKSHWRIRSAIKVINVEISGLRLTARKNKGTKLSALCNRRANVLETKLNECLKEGWRNV